MEEAYVASRIDGRCGVREISALVGKNAQEVEGILQRLVDLGLVDYAGVTARPASSGGSGASERPSAAEPEPFYVPGRPRPPPPPGERGQYGSFVFDTTLMIEDVPLDEHARRRILWAFHHLEVWNHYELLQIPPGASERDIKKAYFARSKEWHPDRFPRGELGVFKKRIEGVYKAINEAYKVLSAADRRADYDKSVDLEPLKAAAAAAGAPAEVVPDAKAVEAARRDEEEARLAERRRATNPVRKRMAQAKEYYDEALALERDGRALDALRAAQLAVTYDDRRREYQDLATRLKDIAGEYRIERFLRRGKAFETTAEWEDASQMFEEAVRIAPNSGRARLGLAYNLMMSGRDAQAALGHAQRAVALLPQESEAHYVLGRLYEATGTDKLAKRAYERALELRPQFQECKKRLKRLKWGF
jgi:curved DNA-binding protein CbpA